MLYWSQKLIVLIFHFVSIVDFIDSSDDKIDFSIGVRYKGIKNVIILFPINLWLEILEKCHTF